MSFERGYIQVYTGNGKGKTTASLGIGLRASGDGCRVIMIQFMKGRRYSEIDSVGFLPGFTIEQYGRDEFVSKEEPEMVDIELARNGLERAKEVIFKGDHDLVILDEINVAIDFGLVKVEDVLDLAVKKPIGMELILTGRVRASGIDRHRGPCYRDAGSETLLSKRCGCKERDRILRSRCWYVREKGIGRIGKKKA